MTGATFHDAQFPPSPGEGKRVPPLTLFLRCLEDRLSCG